MKKLLSLIVAIAMLSALLCTSASASYAVDPLDAHSYYFGTKYATTCHANDDGTVTICAIYSLSSAQKISSLLEMIYPSQRLEAELQNLERFNSASYLLTSVIYSGMGNLESYLSEETRSVLSVTCPKTATQLLSLLRLMPEYTEVPEVQQILDTLDRDTLSGSMVRWGLSTLFSYQLPMGEKTRYQDMSLDELIQAAHEVIASQEYQELMSALEPLLAGNTDSYALSCRFTSAELDEIWINLAHAAASYQPDYVSALDAIRITVPIGVMGMPATSEGIADDAPAAE